MRERDRNGAPSLRTRNVSPPPVVVFLTFVRQARGVELVESDWDFSALITKQLGGCSVAIAMAIAISIYRDSGIGVVLQCGSSHCAQENCFCPFVRCGACVLRKAFVPEMDLVVRRA